MALSSRFAIDTTTLLAGAFLVVASLAFTIPVAGWIGFGVFAGVIVLAGLGLATDHRLEGYALHGLLALAATWSLIASLVFAGSALTWLVFAGAVVIAVLAVTDLIAHEVTTERVVHQLEVTPTAPAEHVIA